jgi:CheY-like chemotaxis protein
MQHSTAEGATSVRNILLVDDVAENCELIREALTSPKYQFLEAGNGP